MRNQLIEMAAEMINALSVLRLSRSDLLVSVPEGIEIHQRARPVLLLTHAAAADFARTIEEATHGS